MYRYILSCFFLLQSCSLLSRGNVTEVDVEVIGHVRTSEARCDWSYGRVTLFISTQGVVGNLCGDYGDVGSKLTLIHVREHKDKTREGFKIGEKTLKDLEDNKEILK